MFRLLARNAFSGSARNFSSSAPTRFHVAKLTLVGTLTREPEVRITKNNKEYVAYTVVTQNYPLPPLAEGERAPSTFHRVLSFAEHSNAYIRNIKKGSLVYVEAGYEVKEPDPNAEAGSYSASRQVLLKHETIRVLRQPKPASGEESG